MELRPDDIAEILRVFAESDLEELHLDIGGTRLDLSKNSTGGRPIAPPRPASASTVAAATAPAAESPAVPSAPAATAATAASAAAQAESPGTARSTEDGLVELRSPLLGVFYRRPSPDKPPFVEPGSSVEADDPVCIVDVMKMFTRVPAGSSGTIVDILVEDGTLVEHGQVLMTIRPR